MDLCHTEAKVLLMNKSSVRTDMVTVITEITMSRAKKISNTNNNVNRKKSNFSVGKTRHRNESCMCGNKYCNSVAKFLGSVVNMKCSYKRPSDFDNERFPKKLKRSRIIHSQILKWRQDQDSTPPSRTARFNEIHFSIMFLKEHKGCSRLPMEISMDLARSSKMFDHDFVWNNKTLVIPTLKTREAIQVSGQEHVYFFDYVFTETHRTYFRIASRTIPQFPIYTGSKTFATNPCSRVCATTVVPHPQRTSVYNHYIRSWWKGTCLSGDRRFTVMVCSHGKICNPGTLYACTVDTFVRQMK